MGRTTTTSQIRKLKIPRYATVTVRWASLKVSPGFHGTSVAVGRGVFVGAIVGVGVGVRIGNSGSKFTVIVEKAERSLR